jgi:hypothetical protein
MINCLWVQFISRLSSSSLSLRREGLRQHIVSCASCRANLRPDLLLDKILETRETAPSADAFQLPVGFYDGVRQRIGRLQLENAGAQTPLPGWEAAILQLQRFILAGGAAAMLFIGLVAYADSRNANSSQRESGLEAFIDPTRGERMIITRAEPLSQDDVLFALVTEETENARR